MELLGQARAVGYSCGFSGGLNKTLWILRDGRPMVECERIIFPTRIATADFGDGAWLASWQVCWKRWSGAMGAARD